jgi:hypothetical protein
MWCTRLPRGRPRNPTSYVARASVQAIHELIFKLDQPVGADQLFRREALGQRNDRMLEHPDLDTCIGFGGGAETTWALQEATRLGLEAFHFEIKLQTL